MAVELPANPPSFSGQNPFRLVWEQPQPSLEYFVDGRTECISRLSCQTFQRIFEENTLQEEYITESAAADVVKLSKLSEDGLAELWEIALRATHCSSPVTSPPRQSYLTKNEFFVLLSELRLRLALPDAEFSSLLLSNPESAVESPRARNNPFRKSMAEFPPLFSPPLRRPPTPPKAVDIVGTDLFYATKSSVRIRVEELPEQGTSQEQLLSLADGYTEYNRHFAATVLTIPSLADIPDIILTPIKESTSVPLSSDKEVALYDPVSEPDLRELAQPVIRSPRPSTSPSTGNLFDEFESVAQAVCELDVSPSRDRWDANDFGPVPYLSSNHDSSEGAIERNKSRRSRSSVTSMISPSIRGRDAPIRTGDSDLLAEQRLKDLTSRLHRQQSQKSKRNSIGSALSLVRKKSTIVKPNKLNPIIDLDQAPSGFSYPALAEALQDAVAEGNMPLIASLFNLGANVNYSSVKNRAYHNILQVAVASRHWQMVDYFLKMGADGVTVDQALTTAFFANNLDLAIKLVPHADVYHLQAFDSPGPACQKLFASSLGRVARDTTMPQDSRRKLLEFFMKQKYFESDRVVFRIFDTENQHHYDFSTMATLVNQLDVEGVKQLLPRLSTTRLHQSTDLVEQIGAICCMRPHHWQQSPDRALEMLQILVSHSPFLDEVSDWPGQGAMTPLACAVAGGSLEGVSILLGLGADPECYVYLNQDSGKETEEYSALGCAAMYGRMDICTVLVEAGATPWRASFKGYTPLFLACEGGHLEVVQYVLSLDIERGMVDSCLLAAVQGDEPRIVEVLLDVGASITPKAWILVMERQPKPHQRGKFLEIIDVLLSRPSVLLEEVVLAAIDSGNFAGLSRVLERRNGDLDFDKNAVFGNWRWAQGHGSVDCRYRTCLSYAQDMQARDFVALMQSYGWTDQIRS